MKTLLKTKFVTSYNHLWKIEALHLKHGIITKEEHSLLMDAYHNHLEDVISLLGEYATPVRICAALEGVEHAREINENIISKGIPHRGTYVEPDNLVREAIHNTMFTRELVDFFRGLDVNDLFYPAEPTLAHKQLQAAIERLAYHKDVGGLASRKIRDSRRSALNKAIKAYKKMRAE